MRHVDRTQKISIGWLHEQWGDTYEGWACSSSLMCADLFTKAFATKDRAYWWQVVRLIAHLTPNEWEEFNSPLPTPKTKRKPSSLEGGPSLAVQDDPKATKTANGETQVAKHKKGSSKKASLGKEFDMGIPLVDNAFGAIRVQDGDFWKRGKGVWIRYHNIPEKLFSPQLGPRMGPTGETWGSAGFRLSRLGMGLATPSTTTGTRGATKTWELSGRERRCSSSREISNSSVGCIIQSREF